MQLRCFFVFDNNKVEKKMVRHAVQREADVFTNLDNKRASILIPSNTLGRFNVH